MSRLIISKKDQESFFLQLKMKSNVSWDALGEIFHVSGRTFRDWKRGKFTVPTDVVHRIHKAFRVPLPSVKKVVGDYWCLLKGARKGARRRFELYGCVATPEGRKKGGAISQQRRKEDPEKYRALGCIVRKDFPLLRRTKNLAEMVGIILGDGALTNTQLRISLDRTSDKAYAFFVSRLMKSVFHEKPSWTERENVITLTISGMGLVEALENIGLLRGNKVVHQVGLPRWIHSQIQFQNACVRGLMDTDGGVYFHRHRVNGILYRNFGLSFSSHSFPLIKGMSHILRKLKFNFKIQNSIKIYIYELSEVQRYFREIGTHNPKNIRKLRFHLQRSTRIS